MDAVRQQIQNAEDQIEDIYLEEEEELEELELDEPTLNEVDDTLELTLATIWVERQQASSKEALKVSDSPCILTIYSFRCQIRSLPFSYFILSDSKIDF